MKPITLQLTKTSKVLAIKLAIAAFIGGAAT